MQRKHWIAGLAGATLLAGAMATTAMADRGERGAGMRMGGGMPPFAEVDADADGKITKAEMQAWRAARVAGLDADSDGFLSREEVKAHAMRGAEARADSMVARMFDTRDSDGDGKLGVAEMMVPPGAGRMFDRIDADGDGAITQAEIGAARDRMAERRGEGGRGHHRGKPPMHGLGDGAEDN
jgi:hypothetical protein